MSYAVRSRDQHLLDDGPKRILALDGGGVRGIATLQYLAKIEKLLAERHGASDFKLCHYFDLIAGTSTGSIIAAGLARGMGVREIIDRYQALADKVFQGSWFRFGAVRAKFDAAALT